MKKIIWVCILTAVASAEVVVSESVDPISGAKTVGLGVLGDKSYSSLGTPPVLVVRCQQLNNRKRVDLLLRTGAVIEDAPDINGMRKPTPSNPLEMAMTHL